MGGSDVTVRGDLRRTSDAFAALGVAAFAFDLRGYGNSRGAKANPIATTGADVCSALAALRARAGIGAIGLYGSSRGGWVAPSAAAQCSPAALVVLFAAPAVSPREQLTRYRLDRFRRAGHGRAERREAQAYIDLTWRAFASDADWAHYEAARRDVDGKGWLDLLQGPPSRESDGYAWLAQNRDYDPLPALGVTKAPVLALFGEFDTVVDPAVNARLLERALRRGGNGDVVVVSIPGADHGLSLVGLARPFDPLPVHRARGFNPSVWARVRAFLQERGTP
jgi:hypothetical protein